MRYRIKRVGACQYYAEHSHFGIFWRSCYRSCYRNRYTDENILVETWRPHVYPTFAEAVEACKSYETILRGKEAEPVEITNLTLV